MGVYIDMEMPPDGRYTLCITHDSDGGVHWVIQNQDTLEFLKHGVVTEITEPYGRLINADALMREMHNVILEDGEDRRIFYSVIERQPIIIPASEEALSNE